MKHISIYLFISVLMAACGGQPAPQSQAALEQPPKECDRPSDAVLESIVRIDVGDSGTASGVVVGEDTVITVAHAIDEQALTTVRTYAGHRIASVTFINPDQDLAILKVDTGALEAIPLSMEPPQLQETLWAIGFPLALEQRVSLGYYEKLFNGRLYTSNHVNSGVSGGGLLKCEDGQFVLAGVVHGYVALQRNNQWINIGDSTSVPSQAISQFLTATDSL